MTDQSESELDRVQSIRIECPSCGMPFDVPEYIDRWSCDCGESWQVGDDLDEGWEQTIYNRPARVDAVYTDVAKVWWQDNNTLGYVPVDALGEEVA